MDAFSKQFLWRLYGAAVCALRRGIAHHVAGVRQRFRIALVCYYYCRRTPRRLLRVRTWTFLALRRRAQQRGL